MPVDPDVIAELRSLRKGRGLSLASLARCGRLLAALGLDAAQAEHRIVTALREMGDDLEVRALRNAYAIDMSTPGKLTDRRSDFALANSRHVDTVENYENATIEELAQRLDLSLPQIINFTQLASVRRHRIEKYSLLSADASKSSFTDVNFLDNSADPRQGSLPINLVVGKHWMTSLTLAIHFEDDEDNDDRIVMFNKSDLFEEIVFGKGVKRVQYNQFTKTYPVTIDEVTDGQLYALVWYG